MAAGDSAGDGPERGRDGPPGVGIGMRARQVQDDPAYGACDARTDLQQDQAQPSDLRPRERSAVAAELEFLQQDVGGGRQRDAELVGPEARATRAAEGD